jgi:hypothetical protein
MNETGREPRRSRRTWVLVAAGAVVVAAGVLATLRTASSSGTPSPLAAVTAALAHTSAKSYSFSLDCTVRLAGRDAERVEVSGAFDPAHHLGTELLTTSRPMKATIRFIGQDEYTQVSPESRAATLGKPWNKAPAPPSRAGGPRGDTYGFVSDQPVSPAELSGVLQYSHAVHDAGPVSGRGWTGTRYTFTRAPLADRQGSVSGTVDVDRQGRVRRMMTRTIQGRIATTREFTFGDFGGPVTATAPPATQVTYTGSPYWGFYF